MWAINTKACAVPKPGQIVVLEPCRTNQKAVKEYKNSRPSKKNASKQTDKSWHHSNSRWPSQNEGKVLTLPYALVPGIVAGDIWTGPWRWSPAACVCLISSKVKPLHLTRKIAQQNNMVLIGEIVSLWRYGD